MSARAGNTHTHTRIHERQGGRMANRLQLLIFAASSRGRRAEKLLFWGTGFPIYGCYVCLGLIRAASRTMAIRIPPRESLPPTFPRAAAPRDFLPLHLNFTLQLGRHKRRRAEFNSKELIYGLIKGRREHVADKLSGGTLRCVRES